MLEIRLYGAVARSPHFFPPSQYLGARTARSNDWSVPARGTHWSVGVQRRKRHAGRKGKRHERSKQAIWLRISRRRRPAGCRQHGEIFQFECHARRFTVDTDAEAVWASLSSRLRCLSGRAELRVPAADCKSRVLASDHAISDGDVIEARAAHAAGSESHDGVEAERERTVSVSRTCRARRSGSITSASAAERTSSAPARQATPAGARPQSAPGAPGYRGLGEPRQRTGGRGAARRATGKRAAKAAKRSPGHSRDTRRKRYPQLIQNTELSPPERV